MNVWLITHNPSFRTHFRTGPIATHLARLGHAVTLVDVADEAHFRLRIEQPEPNLTRISSPSLLRGGLRAGWGLHSALRRILALHGRPTPDIIYAFESRPATIFPTLCFARREHIPIVYDWSDWYGRGGLIQEQRPAWYRLIFGGLETWFEEAFRSGGAGHTVIANALAERLHGLGVDAGQVTFVPGGADLERFRPGDRQRARQRLRLPEDAELIAFSALDVRFDFPLVLTAFAEVQATRPQTRLLITGKPHEPLLHAIQSHPAVDRIHCLGVLSHEDYPIFLQACDLGLVPMRNCPANRGRWPNKVSDYLAAGLPFVGNPVGEVARLHEAREVGLLGTTEASSFAQAILRLLSDADLREQQQMRGRQIAETHLAWPHLVAQVETRLQSAIATSHGDKPERC